MSINLDEFDPEVLDAARDVARRAGVPVEAWIASIVSPDQKPTLAAIVEARPDREVDGVVRWRRVDLKRVIVERFGVDYHERYVGTLLKKIGFSHISARPRHPGQDALIIEAFKKTTRAR